MFGKSHEDIWLIPVIDEKIIIEQKFEKSQKTSCQMHGNVLEYRKQTFGTFVRFQGVKEEYSGKAGVDHGTGILEQDVQQFCT